VVVLLRKGLLRIMQKVFRGGLAAERFVLFYTYSFPLAWQARENYCWFSFIPFKRICLWLC